jgi:hypothetical protein
VTLVKAFKEMPNAIFVAEQIGMENFLSVILPEGRIRCEEIHKGFILDVHLITWNNQLVVFTACQD